MTTGSARSAKSMTRFAEHCRSFSASTLIVNPVVSAERASFDPLKDLTQLALIAKGPLLFIVNPSVADSVQDFVAERPLMVAVGFNPRMRCVS